MIPINRKLKSILTSKKIKVTYYFAEIFIIFSCDSHRAVSWFWNCQINLFNAKKKAPDFCLPMYFVIVFQLSDILIHRDE